MNKLIHQVKWALFSACLCWLLAPIANACTRVLWNSNDQGGIIVGRSMDWPESTMPVITVFPRGITRDGGKIGPEQIVKENPARWTSKYGSMVTTVYGVGTADGFNEKGLATHMLYLRATDLPARDVKKPGLQIALWGQYLLDNAANVNEALQLLDKIQLVMVEVRGFKASVHLVLEDASGDSAIIEYIDGKPVVHHGKQYHVVTNDPTYDQQLALAAKYNFAKPSSDMALPGNVTATDRFVRASYYAALLPKTSDERQAIASMLAVMRNVSVPFGAPYPKFGIYNTEYRTVADLSKKYYFFELTDSPNVIWAGLNQFNLQKGAPVMALDPHNPNDSGDVSKLFKPLDKAPF